MTPWGQATCQPMALEISAFLATMPTGVSIGPFSPMLPLEATMSTPRTLTILLFDDVEVLDFCGPFEVFSVASRFTDPPAFNVLTVAEKAGPVVTRGGLSVNPHHRLLDC